MFKFLSILGERVRMLIYGGKGRTQGGSSMAYSVTKAAGIQLMKCIASTQGPKTRINAVLPGLLLTEWVSLCRPTSRVFADTTQGKQYSEERIAAIKQAAALKHEVRTRTGRLTGTLTQHRHSSTTVRTRTSPPQRTRP
jgi:NAD(P)-dependent dehydrogenase (short-subunit alcohol dehydrogenase family)